MKINQATRCGQDDIKLFVAVPYATLKSAVLWSPAL